MSDPAFFPTLFMCGLLVVLIGLLRATPRCPSCGSFRAEPDSVQPKVRQCLACAHIYEIR